MSGAAATFPLVARRRVAGLSFGGIRSTRRGTGSDLAGSRPYRPGDPVRAIDWAASARLSLARGADEFVVREHFADEAPRLVVVCDRRPAMGLYREPWLSKPEAVGTVCALVSRSGLAARAFIGYLDHAGDGLWRPPASQRPLSEHEGRPFDAPEDTVARALAHLADHRRDAPPGSFVFVISDFLAGPPRAAWRRALERRWEVVPVVVQDAVWERSFPQVAGIVVPFADPRTGRVAHARLSAREAAARRAENERRWDETLAGFRSLDVDPVVVDDPAPSSVLDAFLAWADARFAVRGRR